MSEQNILNPSQTSLFNPDWGYTEGLPEMRSLFQAMSGKMYSRRQMGRGRVYDLAWNNRDQATKHSLQQWAQQYENDFFSLADWERSRYFCGRFEGPLTFSPAGNQRYNIRGRFIVRVWDNQNGLFDTWQKVVASFGGPPPADGESAIFTVPAQLGNGTTLPAPNLVGFESFQLIGHPVPEPSSLAILLLAGTLVYGIRSFIRR